MQEVADHLIDAGIIAPIAGLRGLRMEQSLRPCSRLSDDELQQVAEFRSALSARIAKSSPATGLSR
ncbi:MAG: hypothetical protein WBG92_23510 [Thiohalocapsa sp.]